MLANNAKVELMNSEFYSIYFWWKQQNKATNEISQGVDFPSPS